MTVKAVDLVGNVKTVVLEVNVLEKGGGQGLDIVFLFSFVIPIAIITGTIIGYYRTRKR